MSEARKPYPSDVSDDEWAFACRRCHGLVYASSQESDSRVYALARAGSARCPASRAHRWRNSGSP